MDERFEKYIDMLHMPHHISVKRERMPIYDRAAQFSPFAALTGHDAAIKETARITEHRIELSESEKAGLDEKLNTLTHLDSNNHEIIITYFEEDSLKTGGRYVNIKGTIVKIDFFEKRLIMSSGDIIKFDDIYKIDGEVFQKVYNE